MAGVSCRTAHAKDEQAAAAITNRGQVTDNSLYLVWSERAQNSLGFGQVGLAETCHDGSLPAIEEGSPAFRHLAKVLRPNLCRKHLISLGRKPACTSSGQRSRGS